MHLSTLSKLALVLPVAFSWLTFGCCKQSEKDKAESSLQATEYVASLKAIQKTLAQNTLPPPGPCPKLEVKPEKGYGGWDGFAQTATPGLFAKLDGNGSGKDELETWGWLSSDWLEELILKESGEKTAGFQASSHVTMLAKSPYIVIFWDKRRAMPKVSGDDGFEGGYFEGDVIVFERKTGNALCRTAVAASSSEEVSHKTRGISAKSAEDALNDDFRKQFANAASAALKRISPTLKISVH